MRVRSTPVERALWWFAVAMLVVAGAGFAGLDGVLAAWAARPPDGDTVWSRGTAILDLVTGKKLSLLAILLAATGLGFNAVARMRWFGRPLLYAGLVHLSSTIASEALKPAFGRLRPWQPEAGAWFAGGDSFPSGHAGFYGGLAAALVMLFPRWAPLLIAPALFIGAARIVSHLHFLSDVAASFAVAALLAIGWARLLDRDGNPSDVEAIGR